jgi:hypothetical protein|tara:strand:+ start:2619 stop:2837 length:219 start_codon:yes stop_codon:yes gene_type:complete
MEKEITIKCVSSRGHDTFVLNPSLALEKVREETQENGKWAYVDGNFKSFDNLTQADLKEAQEIVLVNALLGG